MLTVSTAVLALALMAWGIVEIIRHGITLWASAVLVYLALVGITLWILRNDTVEKVSPSPSVIPPADRQPKNRGEEVVEPKKTAQEIILEVIRAKGRAKREDLLPVTKLSKSSLGRVLDEMEKNGLIEQVGECKGAYYKIKI